jgi:regulator of sirC expression with transglutaminase-like and TPR domain
MRPFAHLVTSSAWAKLALASHGATVHFFERMPPVHPRREDARFTARFEDLFSTGEDGADVALGAALIARDVYDDLDVRALLGRFDELAAPLSRLGLGRMNVRAQALEMAHYVFERQGFAGNEADYYDPKNSLLPDVLERRLGIPITLALVYCEIARRVGVRARGISFPGHFLVRIDPPLLPPPAASLGNAPPSHFGSSQPVAAPGSYVPLIIDPFFNGRILDERSLAALLRRVAGPGPKLRPEHLAPASPRVVLTRMLTNLKAVYLSRGETSRALLALDRLVTLNPDQTSLLRERGQLAARLGSVEVARADLNRCLELDPSAREAPEIRAELKGLSAARHWLN